jgi:glycosyltransferase involved in cell wall biosynthesis
MRFLFLVQHLVPAPGGAERSLLTLIRELQRRGHEVDWYCAWNEDRLAAVDVARFDWVVTQLAWTERALELAARHGVRTAVFVRSYELGCGIARSDPRLHAECGQRCAPCPHRREAARDLLGRADLLLASSLYMQGFLAREHSLASEVVPPFIDARESVAAAGPRDTIAMDQVSWAKGTDVFAEVARRLPGRRFRVVGYEGWHPGIELPPNVEVTGPLRPREVYQGVRLWLSPARWNEPFGRTNVEALLNGIPVIARRAGAVASDGVLEHGVTGYLAEGLDVGEWLHHVAVAEREYDRLVSAIAGRDLHPWLADATVPRFLQLAGAAG